MRNKVVIAALVLALLGAGAYAWRTFGWGTFSGKVNPLGLDLSRPDALLITQNLAALPRDLLKNPVAARVLPKDLAFYYETHEDRLSALGAIKRIAYEHDLKWSDELLRRVLDEPAQVALWRDGKGALRHYAVAISRNNLAALLEEASKVALKDTQLTKAGELSAGLGKVPLFALSLSPRRTLLFASRGDRLVLLSDAGMVLNKDNTLDQKAASAVAKLLESNPYTQQFAVDNGNAAHRLFVGAQTLAFGYQKYFPAFEALRVELAQDGNIATALLVDPARGNAQSFAAQALLQTLPAQPAFCAVLPVDWSSANALAQSAAGGAKAVAAQGQGPVGACWYGNSQLHTPVFATHLKEAANITKEQLQPLLDWAMKPSVEGSTPEKADANGIRRTVRAPYAAKRTQGYQTALLSAGKALIFSPDQTLADRAAQVAGKRFPSIADTFGGANDASITVAIVTPSSLAQLIRSEADELLVPETEPHLRAAAQRHLWPRLDDLAKLPAARASIAASAAQGARAWHTVRWQTAESAPQKAVSE